MNLYYSICGKNACPWRFRSKTGSNVFRPTWWVLLITIFGLLGCTSTVVKRDDPLIGKIVSTLDRKEIPYGTLTQRVLESDVVYLGENHDNADHHQIQLRIVGDLIKNGRRPRLGFELFSVDQTGYLMAFVSAKSKGPHAVAPEKAERILRRQLGWENRTDSDWAFYFRLVELAREHELTVFGADLPKGIVRRLTRGGIDSLTNVEKALLHPTDFKDEHYQRLMYGKFTEAHCGWSLKSLLERLYGSWIARNDAMAHSIAVMIGEIPDEPIVMILGGGHVEHNMGVYERTAYLKPGIRQLNLRFREIAIRPLKLEDYFQKTTVDDREFPPAHEYLWFTQRVSYQDPCLRFRKQLQRMKHP
ncbi:MAG: ChaN family lipoprotein [Proteobacteria bacterium]|nr:ChaN family lipoprotein [Pseudomonadota bacterium]